MKKPKIIPKIAYFEYSESVDEFFEEWGDNNDRPPTQEDYDVWLIVQYWAILCDGNIYKTYIKLREKL